MHDENTGLKPQPIMKAYEAELIPTRASLLQRLHAAHERRAA